MRNDKLKTHMKVHEKERIKSFLCDQCDFRTVEKRTLKRHKQIHEKANSSKHKIQDLRHVMPITFFGKCPFHSQKYTLYKLG